jgi:OPA family sugar phosphate sensor protein UhpC-like MFS transporter
MGLIGIASYAGAGIQELISGFLISDKKVIINNIATYDFSIARYFWFGAALLSVVIALMVWNAKIRE